MDDVKIEIEKLPEHRVQYGSKMFRAHIIGPTFDHHAEADSPQEALVLAAMRWHKMSK